MLPGLLIQPGMIHPRTGRTLLSHETRSKELSPRVKLAARFYATGLAATKAEAATMAGLAPSTFYLVSTTEQKVSDIIAQIDRELESEAIDTKRLIERLGRRAVRNIAQIMEDSNVKSDTRLKAAQDLADRSPETAKTTNINANISTPVTREQFEMMRDALLESGRGQEKYSAAAKGNFVTVDDASSSRALDLVKERAPLALPPGGEEAA